MQTNNLIEKWALPPWLAHIIAVEVSFWQHARTRTVMFMAGLASFLWGVSLLLEQNSGFQASGFAVMRALLPAWCWAVLFLLHTACVFVCRWSMRPIRRFELSTCFYGFVIWSFYVVASWLSQGRYVVGTSVEVVMVLMLGWSLRRAGRKPADGATDDGV